MASPILAGLGNSLSNVVPTLEEIRNGKAKREAMAMEMALRQQQIAQDQQRMDLEKQKFSAELPFLQSQPQRYAFEQGSKNPDWLGVPGMVDLANKIGISTPSQVPQASVIGNVVPAKDMNGQVSKMPSVQDAYSQANVYPQTQIPIPQDRQAKMALDNAAIAKGNLENSFLQDPSSFISRVTNGIAPQQQQPTQQQQPAPQQNGMPLPPKDQRIEGQVYLTPSGAKAIWKNGNLILASTPGAAPVPATGAQAGNLNDPMVRQRLGTALTIGTLGKIMGNGVTPNMVMTPPGSSPQEHYANVAAEEQAKSDFKDKISPALIQRSQSELADAAKKTSDAVAEMQRLYPGIDQAYQLMRTKKENPSIGSLLTGKGNVPYNDALSMAKAWTDRQKYGMFAGPYNKLIQNASFANIDQLGQVPGIRNITILRPMFQEHQSKFGYETPLQSYARMVELQRMMQETAQDMGSKFQSNPQVQ